MPDDVQLVFLLVSGSPELAAAIASSLADIRARVLVASSTEAAFEIVRGACAPSLVLLDAELPALPIEQALAAIHAAADDRRFPIVVISDRGMHEWRLRLNEGIIDDLFLREMPSCHWRLRTESVLLAFRRMRELEHLRETSSRDLDPLTGLANRGALVSMLFRETDRVQRMNTSLSLMLFEVNDIAHWRGRLGAAACDDLLKQIVSRVQRLLRSYDLFGRMSNASFALGLPGCTPVNAVSLAERIRAEVFGVPFPAGGTAARTSANFGIAPSHGRSPLVVLRDAEQALEAAKTAGPEVIRTAKECPKPPPPPAEFLSAIASMDRLTR